MSKNIIICCDGTGNHIVSYPSNVLHTYTACLKSEAQVCFYNPGLGTTPLNPDGTSQFSRIWTIVLGLGLGIGIKRDIRNAYRFLIDNYSDGDKIFLFGFSRGAYTVRVLAGFLYMYGLMERHQLHLFDYCFDLFGRKHDKKKNNIYSNAGKFSKRFSRPITIHFMGIWDTVSSYGWLYNFKSFPYTHKLNNVLHVRHAVAYHETRVFYQPELVTVDVTVYDHDAKVRKKQDLKEVWFAGVHSDVGGSYHDEESGLAMIPLSWILSEASILGLKLSVDEWKELLKPKKTPRHWVRKNIIHENVKKFFKVLELLPRFKYQNHPYADLYFDYKRKRTVAETYVQHPSCQYILSKINQKDDYAQEDLSRFYEDIEFLR